MMSCSDAEVKKCCCLSRSSLPEWLLSLGYSTLEMFSLVNFVLACADIVAAVEILEIELMGGARAPQPERIDRVVAVAGHGTSKGIAITSLVSTHGNWVLPCASV